MTIVQHAPYYNVKNIKAITLDFVTKWKTDKITLRRKNHFEDANNLIEISLRGGHLSVKTDPLDKSGRPDHPPANTYSSGYGLGYLFFSGFGRATDIMFLVGWLPDPPDQINIHTKFSLTRPPFSLI